MASPGTDTAPGHPGHQERSRDGNGINDEADGVMGPAVPVSGKPNATYWMADFHRIMIAACVLGISAFGYAAATRRTLTSKMDLPDRRRAFPCGEWIRNVIARVDAPLWPTPSPGRYPSRRPSWRGWASSPVGWT